MKKGGKIAIISPLRPDLNGKGYQVILLKRLEVFDGKL